MEEKKKSKYSYTEGEKQINRALKVQEKELGDLAKKSNDLSTSVIKNDESIQQTQIDIENLEEGLKQMKARALKLASERGIEVPSHLRNNINRRVEKPKIDDRPYLADEKIPVNDIPSWEEVMVKTDNMVPEDVVLEDLLSDAEIQYCIEDINRIHDEFAQKTKLSKVDIAFLMVATALQTARWIIIQQIMGDLGETINEGDRIHNKEGDKQKKTAIKDWNEEHKDKTNVKSEKGYPTWKDILFGQYERTDGRGKSSGVCPYDAQANAPAGFDDGGKGNHRVHTLGHDPILGWIFGTANLMTCTISLGRL